MPVLGKTKKEVLSEFRCSEILEAARRVFAKKGYSEATVDEIAEAAEVAKGTVYLYFRSKRAVYLAALREGIEGLYEETTKRVGVAKGIEEKLRVFLETRIRYFDAHRDFFRIYHSEFGNIFAHPGSGSQDFKKLYGKHVAILEQALDEAIQQREVRAISSEATAMAIYDVSRGFIARRLLAWSKEEASEDVSFILDLVWKGIGKR